MSDISLSEGPARGGLFLTTPATPRPDWTPEPTLAVLTKEQEAAARQAWRTPPELWQLIQLYWGPSIDIAADSTNHLCDLWAGPGHPDGMVDGLVEVWSNWAHRHQCLYCNPGFSNLGAWCRHVRHETDSGFPCGIVMGMVAPSTAWWNDWAMLADEIVLLTPRVQFLPPDGIKQSSNSHDNCLLIYRCGPPRFGHAGPRVTTWQWCVPRRKRSKGAI